MIKVRCAVYTRKSSEEGLEQSFNSLHAQREACEAYVLSQASEGWSLLPAVYDDGGLSGGTLERPALQRLLADIAAGTIDIVVVYKVDRLTRSLLDFAKLVETFDKAGTSFVSITQSFNTTTSMGRLTLNMLLSFAQFEREVTAERIRDKIAASKQRGMWMGGTPPLGYRPNGRTLTIVEDHAALVRTVFERYLHIGNVRLLVTELTRDGALQPHRQSETGRRYGGGAFTRGQIYRMLSNPVYIGEIPHRDRTYPGQHPAIIDRILWDAVQKRLADGCQGEQRADSTSERSLLAGKIVDDAGEPLVATHACKGTRRYRYYVSRSLQHGIASATDGWRIPARELEGAVSQLVGKALSNPMMLIDQMGATVTADMIARISTSSDHKSSTAAEMLALVGAVRIGRTGLEVDLCCRELRGRFKMQATSTTSAATLRGEMRLTRTGRAVRLVHDNGQAAGTREPDASVIKLLQRARGWWAQLSDGEIDMTTLAARERISTTYVTRVMRLAFLAPSIVERILDGRHSAHLDGKRLTETGAIPMRWAEQEAALL